MSSEYWKDRMAEALTRISNKSIKQIESQMKKYYATAMKHTIAQFEATYDKLMAAKEDDKEITPNSLYNLDKYYAEKFGMKINVAENGLLSVAMGGGVAMGDSALLKKLVMNTK